MPDLLSQAVICLHSFLADCRVKAPGQFVRLVRRIWGLFVRLIVWLRGVFRHRLWHQQRKQHLRSEMTDRDVTAESVQYSPGPPICTLKIDDAHVPICPSHVPGLLLPIANPRSTNESREIQGYHAHSNLDVPTIGIRAPTLDIHTIQPHGELTHNVAGETLQQHTLSSGSPTTYTQRNISTPSVVISSNTSSSSRRIIGRPPSRPASRTSGRQRPPSRSPGRQSQRLDLPTHTRPDTPDSLTRTDFDGHSVSSRNSWISLSVPDVSDHYSGPRGRSEQVDALPSHRGDRTASPEPVHDPEAETERERFSNVTAVDLADHHGVIARPARFRIPGNVCQGCTNDSLRPSMIFPVTTTNFNWQKYGYTPQIDSTPSHQQLPPMVRLHANHARLVLGWEYHVHPEGAPYFYNSECRVFTLADLFNETKLAMINRFVEQIEAAKLEHEEDLPLNLEYAIQLFQDVDDSEAPPECHYYMVDHDNRVLFWMNKFDMTDMLHEVPGVTSELQIRFELESHYWTHWELFPAYKTVTGTLLRELTGILIHAGYDSMSSNTSTAPYTNDEIQHHLKYIKNMRAVGEVGGYVACTFGRMMNTFYHEKFMNFAGQPCARLNRNQAVYRDIEYSRSYLIYILSPLLFFAPDVHQKSLEKLWIDRSINQVPWKAFIRKIQDDWKEFVLFSTVLLTANTALLAVPGVDSTGDNQKPVSARNPVQILSYVSILSSIGSIIMGLLLIRQYRTKSRDTAAEAAEHLDKYTHPQKGLETLAVLYSLPYAGLMWATVTFLASISVLFFDNTSFVTRITVGSVEAFVVLLVCWCIYEAWSDEEDWWLQGVWDWCRTRLKNGTKLTQSLTRKTTRNPSEKAITRSDQVEGV